MGLPVFKSPHATTFNNTVMIKYGQIRLNASTRILSIMF